MFEPLRLAQTDPSRMPDSHTRRARNLGAAVLLTAIRDYRSRDPLVQQTAAAFLYPTTDQEHRHLNWAMAMTEDLNPVWLREMLDRIRTKWDKQRRVQ